MIDIAMGTSPVEELPADPILKQTPGPFRLGLRSNVGPGGCGPPQRPPGIRLGGSGRARRRGTGQTPSVSGRTGRRRGGDGPEVLADHFPRQLPEPGAVPPSEDAPRPCRSRPRRATRARGQPRRRPVRRTRARSGPPACRPPLHPIAEASGSSEAGKGSKFPVGEQGPLPLGPRSRPERPRLLARPLLHCSAKHTTAYAASESGAEPMSRQEELVHEAR